MIDRTILPFVNPPDHVPADVNGSAVRLREYLSARLHALHLLVSGGLRWQNLRSILLTGVQPGAGAPPVVFTTSHNLGKVPELWLWMPQGDMTAYSIFATVANKANWTTATIELSCSVGTQPIGDLFVM